MFEEQQGPKSAQPRHTNYPAAQCAKPPENKRQRKLTTAVPPHSRAGIRRMIRVMITSDDFGAMPDGTPNCANMAA